MSCGFRECMRKNYSGIPTLDTVIYLLDCQQWLRKVVGKEKVRKSQVSIYFVTNFQPLWVFFYFLLLISFFKKTRLEKYEIKLSGVSPSPTLEEVTWPRGWRHFGEGSPCLAIRVPAVKSSRGVLFSGSDLADNSWRNTSNFPPSRRPPLMNNLVPRFPVWTNLYFVCCYFAL